MSTSFLPFSSSFDISEQSRPRYPYDVYQQLSWFLAKLFILLENHLTLSPFLSIPGEKELSRLQKKVQATTEDFKEVVDYFQYTGEGEEVSMFFSYSDLTACPLEIWVRNKLCFSRTIHALLLSV